MTKTETRQRHGDGIGRVESLNRGGIGGSITRAADTHGWSSWCLAVGADQNRQAVDVEHPLRYNAPPLVKNWLIPTDVR